MDGEDICVLFMLRGDERAAGTAGVFWAVASSGSRLGPVRKGPKVAVCGSWGTNAGRSVNGIGGGFDGDGPERKSVLDGMAFPNLGLASDLLAAIACAGGAGGGGMARLNCGTLRWCLTP